jgi:hypothetical protein
LYELYINEEEQLKNEWNELCKVFEDKLMDKNARLSRKFYQLFKEQSAINYDDVIFFSFKSTNLKNSFLRYFIEISRTNSNIFFQFKCTD